MYLDWLCVSVITWKLEEKQLGVCFSYPYLLDFFRREIILSQFRPSLQKKCIIYMGCFAVSFWFGYSLLLMWGYFVNDILNWFCGFLSKQQVSLGILISHSCYLQFQFLSWLLMLLLRVTFHWNTESICRCVPWRRSESSQTESRATIPFANFW